MSIFVSRSFCFVFESVGIVSINITVTQVYPGEGWVSVYFYRLMGEKSWTLVLMVPVKKSLSLDGFTDLVINEMFEQNIEE